jgi:hypothetical protein
MFMIRASLFAAALLIPMPALSQTPPACTKIQFEKGSNSATLNGMVGSDGPFPCYYLQAEAGQTASFWFNRENGNTAFSIAGVADNKTKYTFKTEAKTYTFVVFQMMGANPAPYSLHVGVR